MEEHKSKKKLNINVSDLETAMENESEENTYFLNIENGRIVLVSDETREMLEDIYEESSANNHIEFESILANLDLPELQKESLCEAEDVEDGLGERYIEIPSGDSKEAYDDLRGFAEIVQDSEIRNKLLKALDLRHPFSRFKEIINSYPAEQEKWYQFKDNRLQERTVQWLEEQGIEIIYENY